MMYKFVPSSFFAVCVLQIERETHEVGDLATLTSSARKTRQKKNCFKSL